MLKIDKENKGNNFFFINPTHSIFSLFFLKKKEKKASKRCFFKKIKKIDFF